THKVNIMNLIKSIFLGIIQGLTEFLPVSSSGHLVIAKHLFGFEINNISFEIFLHLGSLLAVLIYFRKDILELIFSLLHIFKPSNKDISNLKFIMYLMIATIVTGILGFSFQDTIEQLFTNPLFAAFMLIITGIIIFISDLIQNAKINIEEMHIWRAIIIGLGQALAIIPGISRSGSTIATSLFLGIKRKQVARFSFLLSVPAILGATVLKFDEFTVLSSKIWINYIAGGIAAFISGWLVIAFLLRIIQKQKLKYFSYYCWTVAIIFIVVSNII
ncbi:MAG: undecaprenyl-diphosphatase UppP, partial [Candidatus Cloacimonadota bacterium]|nr:undecaprenyl-diphosphatase UppP [Candidatus Cloacimonadota bacterium]